MKTNKKSLVVSLLATGLLFAAGHASAIDSLDVGLGTLIAGDTPAGSGTPWVNAKFIDLGFLGAPGVIAGFAAFQNTVELQITTSNGRNPASGPAFTPEQLESFGLSAYPDLAVVQGSGNLAQSESVGQIYLNFNPAKDVSLLQMSWAGAPCCGFPVSGAEPVSFATSQDGFTVGSAGSFDIVIGYSANALGPASEFSSKLVFSYNGAPGSDENLDLSDFNFTSANASSGQGYVALGTVLGTAPGGLAVIGAVPEPGTYAMLALGLLGVGFAVRRRQR